MEDFVRRKHLFVFMLNSPFVSQKDLPSEFIPIFKQHLILLRYLLYSYLLFFSLKKNLEKTFVLLKDCVYTGQAFEVFFFIGIKNSLKAEWFLKAIWLLCFII